MEIQTTRIIENIQEIERMRDNRMTWIDVSDYLNKKFKKSNYKPLAVRSAYSKFYLYFIGNLKQKNGDDERQAYITAYLDKHHSDSIVASVEYAVNMFNEFSGIKEILPQNIDWDVFAIKMNGKYSNYKYYKHSLRDIFSKYNKSIPVKSYACKQVKSRALIDGYLYILYQGKHAKIGISRSVDNRIKSHKSSNPSLQEYKIYYIGYLLAARVERIIKTIYADVRSSDDSSEWFRVSPLEIGRDVDSILERIYQLNRDMLPKNQPCLLVD